MARQITVCEQIENRLPFLRRDNKIGYFQLQVRHQRRCRNQIKKYIQLLHQQTLKEHLEKFKTKIHKIQISGLHDDIEELLIEYIERPKSPSDNLKVSMYIQKELCNMSDAKFQSFINAGADSFPSLRFVRECRYLLNNVFTLNSNSLGNYTYLLNF